VHRTTADPGRVVEGTPWRGTSAAGRGGVLLDHGTHLVYQLLDIAGMPFECERVDRALAARPLRGGGHGVLTVRVSRPAGHHVLHVGRTDAREPHPLRRDAGAIDWTGGELRLERAGTVERLDYSAELEKTAYHRWFAGLFEGFVAALDRGDPGVAAGPFLEDIRRWRASSSMRTSPPGTAPR